MRDRDRALITTAPAALDLPGTTVYRERAGVLRDGTVVREVHTDDPLAQATAGRSRAWLYRDWQALVERGDATDEGRDAVFAVFALDRIWPVAHVKLVPGVTVRVEGKGSLAEARSGAVDALLEAAKDLLAPLAAAGHRVDRVPRKLPDGAALTTLTTAADAEQLVKKIEADLDGETSSW